MRRLALKAALSSRTGEGDLLVVEEFNTEVPKTRVFAKMLQALGACRSALLVAESWSPLLDRATRNLPSVQIVLPDQLNAYQILAFDKVIITKTALAKLEEVLIHA
jgi:large subunit ribosomal protein L4